MAAPLPYATFLRVLRAEGLTVIEHKTDGRSPADHNRNHKGAWGPVHGVLLHHTVTSGHDRTIEICRTGHSTLPGPLCHGVICKQGHIHVVGYGRANHAGLGDDDVLQAVINEHALPPDNEANTDGNRHFYGFECENLGDNKDPWPAVQVDAMVRAAAALLRAHGWNKNGAGAISAIAHAEWQPGKVDPRGPGYPGHAGIRSRVAERLKHPASWSPGSTAPTKPTTPNPPQEEDMDAGDVWGFHGKLPDGKPDPADVLAYVRGTNGSVRAVAEKVDALTAKVDGVERQPLTDDQVAAIASAVAAHPALAQSIADTLATRLKD
ncbi:peptidoglycan recognition protein family protein [Streptomyces rubrogriseus]|uniref:peptidoglycan recognition protein family protein n=1 Tax=Streptomyces rubrogriseus TaxID=194673 RepID=UPI000D59BCC5|nr:N-acetylmuramoyl-L-alanine amidase [Streptomyces rubrogriseus]